MPSEDPFYEAISPTRDALQSLASSLDADPRLTPAADSPGMREIASQAEFQGQWGDEPIEHAHTVGVWKRVLAIDCAHAMVRDLYEDPAPVFAHKVLGRAVIENAASAAWILEPGIGVRLRIARGRNERIHSAKQVLRLEWLPDQERARSQGIVETITRVGEELGFSVTRNGWLEEDRPGFTALIRWMLGEDLGGTIANYYSAVAHGTQYGLVSAVMSVERTEFGLPRAAIGLSSSDVSLALGTAGLGLIRAIQHERALLGRSIADWERIRSEALETFKASILPSTGS